MQIIIDISKHIYEHAKERSEDSNDEWDAMRAIANGTPLPKGHGRLIDADEALIAMGTWEKFGYTETGYLVRNPGNDYVPYVHYADMVKAVSGLPTIIEADRGEEE